VTSVSLIWGQTEHAAFLPIAARVYTALVVAGNEGSQ
jgi:hypothetical protein